MGNVRRWCIMSDILPSSSRKGFGTVIMGIFDEDKVAEIVNLPENESSNSYYPIWLPCSK